jgi:hypothetical protein
VTALRWYGLRFPRDLDPDAVVGFVRTLAMRPRRGLLGTTDPVVFQLTATPGTTSWSVAVSDRQEPWLLAQLRSTVQTVAVEETGPAEPEADAALAVELRVRSPRRSLRIDLPGVVASALLAGFGDLRGDERVVVQWLVGPWLPRHVPMPTEKRGSSDWVSDLADLMVEEHLEYRDVRALERKQAEAVFGCVGRISVHSAADGRARELVQRVLGAFQLVREPGAGLSRRWLPSWAVRDRMKRMQRPLIGWPCPLNASELAALVCWPTEGVRAPGVGFLRQRLLEPAPSVFTPRLVADALAGDAIRAVRVVAEATHPGADGYLTLSPKDALQHLHCIGPTGGGKSTLLANLALQDIAAGRAVVVVEPKGDLIVDLLDRIPEGRVDDVVVIDPTDRSRSVGLNVLAGKEPELVVDQVVHVLHALYAAHWGPRTQDILHAGLLTLARTGGFTLIDLPALLTDPAFRRQVVPKVSGERTLAQFWAWFEALSDSDRAAAIGPVMNKLRAFTLRSATRLVLGQADPAFDFDRALGEGKVVLVNLAKGTLGPETTQLLGALVVSQLWQAILARSRMSPAGRVPAFVYVDEFQDYTRLPTDLGDALAQARGLGVGFHLAHQHMAQLTPELRSAVLSNARSRVVFQTSDDAPALAKTLGGGLTPGDLRELDAFHCYAALVGAGAGTAPASARTRPLPPTVGTARDVRARSAQRWGRPAADIETKIDRRQSGDGLGDAPVGGRRRRP